MRKNGMLLPIASLPSNYGIGAFSKEAYEFVDVLQKSGQSLWQILPLGPTGYGDSPYQSFSTFAGNPYFIDLEELIEEGLLSLEECESCDWGDNEEYIDYEKIYLSRFKILKKAFERSKIDSNIKFNEFCKDNKNWLEDLKYLCLPTEYHEKRVSVRFTTQIAITREFNRHKLLCVA